MSRPKPTILLEKVDKDTYKADQILASAGIWSVFYKVWSIKSIQKYGENRKIEKLNIFHNYKLYVLSIYQNS